MLFARQSQPKPPSWRLLFSVEPCSIFGTRFGIAGPMSDTAGKPVASRRAKASRVPRRNYCRSFTKNCANWPRRRWRRKSRPNPPSHRLGARAWLRLGGDRQPAWQNRAHFFAAAAQAMRRILVDDARRRKAQRHGGKMTAWNWMAWNSPLRWPKTNLLEVDEALDRLAARNVTKAELVKLKFFAGLTIEEAAKVLSISEPTAKRYWAYARAWLFREINSP